ncbi:hypothetical protein BH09CHL1_BH09CHL1_07770 [soil metagenome]
MAIDQFTGFEQGQRSVEDSANLLKRLYLTEREIMRTLGAWHISIANWELKLATPRDWWHDSLHADALRNRVLELRYPRRDVDSDHDPELVHFLGELAKARTDAEHARGIYEVARPALVRAYRAYESNGDRLNDAPSFYHLNHNVVEEEVQIAEMAPIIAALSEQERLDAQPWVDYLEALLGSIGGLLGDLPRTAAPSDHPEANRPAYVIPDRCVRDPRFLPAVVESPTRPAKTERERQVWLAIDHANEVWAVEVPGAFMWHFSDMPWQFYLDVARWGYDELRHALMGMRRLEAWGFEMGIDYPMVGDPYHAIIEKGGDLRDVLALLYYFERQAPAYKQQEKKHYDASGDTATAQDVDFDWADEAIHLRYGYTWLNQMLGANARTELEPLVQRAGDMWETWVRERWDLGEDGYGPYMVKIDKIIADAEAAAMTAR